MKNPILIVAVIALASLAAWLHWRECAEEGPARDVVARTSDRAGIETHARLPPLRSAAPTRKTDARPSAGASRDSKTADPEEKRAAPAERTAPEEPPAVRAERKVTRFYAEVDRWTRERPVTVEDVQEFVRTFNAIPPSLRKGSVHRALNLIPDANVALLAGVLLDKSQPAEVAREVFNDIVNRSEEVKKPILDEIAKDSSHPCYDDARWIFEVTGEKPE